MSEPLSSPLFPALRAAAALLAAVTLVAAPRAHAADTAVVTTPQVRAELVAHAPQGVAAGQPLLLGLLIEHKRDWHTYWKNPGDSGLPTTLAFTLPAGFVAGEIAWPTPQRLPIGPLMNYGYDGKLLLPVAVQVPAGFAGETLPVKLRADWLVCKDVCIPEGGDFTLQLAVKAATAAHAAAFAAAAEAAPKPATGAKAEATVKGDALHVRIAALPAACAAARCSSSRNRRGTAQRRKGGGPLGWRRVERSAAARSAAQRRPGNAAGRARGARRACRPDGRSAHHEPVAAAGPGRAGAVAAPARSPAPDAVAAAPGAGVPGAPSTPALSLGLAIVFALVGGALLNLMPCVFPVLSLKVVGFARKAEDRRKLW
ncbi:MAG: protein-disulfide reductase DsbD family protein [Rubrivivax sp.]